MGIRMKEHTMDKEFGAYECIAMVVVEGAAGEEPGEGSPAAPEEYELPARVRRLAERYGVDPEEVRRVTKRLLDEELSQAA